MALAIGCSQNVISKIELEYSVPDADILCKIADYFHTSVDYLLYRTDQRYSLAPESSSFNSRITEYMFKLQSLTPKEIESIFIIIDGLLDNEINEVIFCYESQFAMMICLLKRDRVAAFRYYARLLH